MRSAGGGRVRRSGKVVFVASRDKTCVYEKKNEKKICLSVSLLIHTLLYIKLNHARNTNTYPCNSKLPLEYPTIGE